MSKDPQRVEYRMSTPAFSIISTHCMTLGLRLCLRLMVFSGKRDASSARAACHASRVILTLALSRTSSTPMACDCNLMLSLSIVMRLLVLFVFKRAPRLYQLKTQLYTHPKNLNVDSEDERTGSWVGKRRRFINIGSEVYQLLDNFWVLRVGICVGMSCLLGLMSLVRESIYSKVPFSAE